MYVCAHAHKIFSRLVLIAYMWMIRIVKQLAELLWGFSLGSKELHLQAAVLKSCRSFAG